MTEQQNQIKIDPNTVALMYNNQMLNEKGKDLYIQTLSQQMMQNKQPVKKNDEVVDVKKEVEKEIKKSE